MRSHDPCRPPKDLVLNVERWTGTEWIADDGKPGLAFVGLDEAGVPYAISTRCGGACFKSKSGCVKDIAHKRNTMRYSCSNGRDVLLWL